MRLKDILIQELKKIGIERIGVRYRKVIASRDPIRTIAIGVIGGKFKIFKGSNEINWSLTLNGEKLRLPPQAYVSTSGGEVILDRDRLLSKIDNFPFIALDCRFYDLHSQKEKKKLKLQIEQTLGVIRKYMWDERLIVAGKKFGYGRYYNSIEEFLSKHNFSNVILLDPNAESIYSGENAECFIIGGIVDKSGNKKGITSKIFKILDSSGFNVEAKKIQLRGDVVGVPDRINHIAEIILKCVFDNKSVEEAIKETQPHIVAKWRLRKEISKHVNKLKINDKIYGIILKDKYLELTNWLNIRWKDFFQVCSEQNIFVISERGIQRLFQS